jgi:predicted amidophosphoribosyltransferase
MRLPWDRGFERVRAISMHTEPLSSALHAYKYDGDRRWRRVFGRLLLGWLQRHPRTAGGYDLILPNPSDPGREPYQHVELLLDAAAEADEEEQWPIIPYGLAKLRSTPQSAGGGLVAKMDAAEQHAAAVATTREIFEDLTAARVLLVDDVFTTGAQLDAVGRRLYEWGADHVDGLVLARQPWR